jgi:hypothetical protein
MVGEFFPNCQFGPRSKASHFKTALGLGLVVQLRVSITVKVIFCFRSNGEVKAIAFRRKV